MVVSKESQSLKLISWLLITTISAIALAMGLPLLYKFAQIKANDDSRLTPKLLKTSDAVVAITALGRLEPQGEVVNLSAPSSINGVKVEKLLVERGDSVKKGQVIAILEEHNRRLLALKQAKDRVEIAHARLVQVQAGAKTGDVEAQKAAIARIQAQLQGERSTQSASIARLKADLQNAQVESRRYQQLFQEGAISASTFDSKRLRMDIVQKQLTEAEASLARTTATLKDQLTEAKAKLSSLMEVRPTDVDLAQAELSSTITAVKQAEEELNVTYIKSPISGQVLQVHTQAGEVVDREKGIAELGKTDQMYAVAEIYQTDIKKVHLGQEAIITSTAFTEEIRGIVSEIGWQVERQSVFSVNPGIDTDRRVVEVKIRLNNRADSKRVAGLTNLQVEVKIPVKDSNK